MNPTFFKPELNIHSAEFRASLPVNVNFDYGTIAPALYDAERKYIRDIVGETLWQQLADYYNNAAHTVNSDYDHLIQLMQSATLRIAYFESFDLLAVNLTDSGIQNPNGEATAYRYQADAAKDTLGRQAFEHLQYFYDALVASGLRTWSDNDPTHPHRQNSLFRTPQEFFATTEQLPDFRLFLKLRQAVTLAEKTDLPYRIGKTLADELLSRPSSGRMADPVILSLAQRFVAFKVFADSIMHLQAYITDSGATVRSLKAEGSTGGTAQQTADSRTRHALRTHYQETAEAAATQLVIYLKSHPETFPEIESVVSSSSPHTHLPLNTTKHSFRV